MFVVKCTGRGLVVKRPGVLSKVQMLNLLLGVGVFSLLPIVRSLYPLQFFRPDKKHSLALELRRVTVRRRLLNQ